MKTFVPKNNEQNWVVVDAAGVPLGRLATLVASRIRGKHRPDFTPNIIQGDFVVVVNAEKVVLTGNKLDGKVYTRYTGYQGGLKTETARQALAKHPERVIEHAVFGMLPKGRQGRALHSRLKVYAGTTHPHAAQKPQQLEVRTALEVK
ncbi:MULTISPECIES: 50S ribosomal protein L13 [Deinococcus]|uniref:Large ribosomal subunit protein uL13 n=1 Tax=Deinococcus geothermalis (strain DSM 11300 / CIP 105573 / AG-3a) TaxID=319795 RepID=RL13_DEIGD|nr:50S ribosomal protein L13 [Deinococcus geothermalis]Q1IXK5.1 RecName: Full=Large ribosomal subunit protein uL13; AltName: Full=50S ribosomal protein L13 [Deinococcus geothermalis DSM 11300]ABF46029.1 ribosomal protein L13 [Deinococcus geothermalis DSM 11300]MBI0445336.1 50S ribosomal protein L13 [Deinococcus sp. DB0503]